MTDDDVARLRDAYPPLPREDPPATTIERLRAAYAASGPPSADRRRRVPSRRAGAGALIAVVLSGSAVAATVGGWHPQLGSPRVGDRPRPSTAGVPAEQMALLGILRRAQTGVDRGRLVRMALRGLSRNVVDGVHVEAIRVIAHSPRSATILIPAEHSGPPDRKGADDVLCLQTLAFQPAVTLTRGGRRTRFGGGYGGGGACGDTTALRTTGIRGGTGESRINTGPVDDEHGPLTHYATLVPDGVAEVTINLRHGRTVTVPVRDNVYRFAVHGIADQLGTVWYDAAGRRVDHRVRR